VARWLGAVAACVLIGVILFGGGSMTLLSGNQISFIEGLLRVFAAALKTSTSDQVPPAASRASRKPQIRSRLR